MTARTVCLYFLAAVMLAGLSGKEIRVDGGTDWPTYLGDKERTHFSPLRQIDTTNVGQLEAAWTFHCGNLKPNARSQIQCSPIIVDGVLYATTPELMLVALDAATGRELWRFDPQTTTTAAGGRLGVHRCHAG